MSKLILDLCGGTGAWSAPYREAGYDVRVVTLPEQDVRLLIFPGQVHGILAAPPCTYFCRMHMCRGRPTDAEFCEGLSVVDACLRVIIMSSPDWWALENPQGYLRTWLGEPTLKFDPCDYGDPWTKRTWIWGNFSVPETLPVPPHRGSWVRKHAADGRLKQPGIALTGKQRAVTPPGFARAFFRANP